MLGPGQQIGDWIVEEQIGAGAMGAVFRCRSVLSHNLRAALKILRSESHSESRGRFLREIETLARLDHRAIVRILGCGEDHERHLIYLVMELLEGESLSQRLAREPIDARTAVRWFHRLCLALEHAHERGVFHRDLKPSNIMLLDSGEVRLVDFGIAVVEEGPPITETGVVVGTFSYLAPEAFLDAAPDLALCDQYSLGQVLCEVLTGEAAFPRPGGVEDARWLALLARQKSDAESLDPGESVAPGLRAIIRRATCLDAGQRFASMGQMAQALGEVALIAPTPRSSSSASAGPSGVRRAPAAVRATSAAAPRPSAAGRAFVAGGVAFLAVLGLGAVGVWIVKNPDGMSHGVFRAPTPPPHTAADGGEGSEDGAPADAAADEATLTYELVPVRAGSFKMGCTPGQDLCQDDERPTTGVSLSRRLLAGRTEVTQGLWTQVTGENPAAFTACGPECPVETVSWCDAVVFANLLSEAEGIEAAYILPERMRIGLPAEACNAMAAGVQRRPAAPGYRLPTEAEWEYLARAGRDTSYPGGTDADAVAWHARNSEATTHPVGRKAANAWGLVDMAGNVWEWTFDGYGLYPGGFVTDQVGAATGPYRVLRGGGWRALPKDVRVADRDRANPGARDDGTGLRLVRTRD